MSGPPVCRLTGWQSLHAVWRAAMSALLSLVLLAGCSASGAPNGADDPGGAVIVTPTSPGRIRGAVLAQPYRVPHVTLTDTAGRPYDLVTAPTAPLTLVFFGYTNCPDVCSLVLADLAAALHRADPRVRSDTQVLFITTDPVRDTPRVMRSYLDRFDPAFTGLTGPMARIKKAATALGVPLEGKERLTSGGYEVGHGAQVIGVAPDSEATVVWTPRTPVTDLTADFTTLVRRYR